MPKLEPPPIYSKQLNQSGISFGVWYDYWNKLNSFINDNSSSNVGVSRSSTQSISTSTLTKVQLDSKSYDLDSSFDADTNYRFSPSKAGKYLIVARLHYSSNSSGVRKCDIRLNGTTELHKTVLAVSGNETEVESIGVVEMDGSDDYIEVYAYQTSGSSINLTADTSLFTIYVGV